MARILTLSGDEIGTLSNLEIEGTAFSADVAPNIAARGELAPALLRTVDSILFQVKIEAWEVQPLGSQKIGRVRGIIIGRAR